MTCHVYEQYGASTGPTTTVSTYLQPAKTTVTVTPIDPTDANSSPGLVTTTPVTRLLRSVAKLGLLPRPRGPSVVSDPFLNHVQMGLATNGALVTCTGVETSGHGIVGATGSASTYLPPPAPTGVTVTPISNTSVSVAFTPQGTNIGSFTVTCTSSSGGAPIVVTGPTSPITVGPFLNPGGVANDVIVCSVTETFSAPNGLTGAATSNSASISRTSGTGCSASNVTAPVVLSQATGEKSAVVSWKQGVADPASCYAGSLITPSGSGTPYFLAGHGSTTVINGLTDGAQVSFTVAVVTGAGIGPASVPTATITIGAPAAVHAAVATHAGKGSIKVSFKAGKSNGAAITKFTVTCGSKSASGKASPLTVNGLTAGKSYTCTVTATNSRGTSRQQGRTQPRHNRTSDITSQ